MPKVFLLVCEGALQTCIESNSHRNMRAELFCTHGSYSCHASQVHLALEILVHHGVSNPASSKSGGVNLKFCVCNKSKGIGLPVTSSSCCICHVEGRCSRHVAKLVGRSFYPCVAMSCYCSKSCEHGNYAPAWSTCKGQKLQDPPMQEPRDRCRHPA